MLLKNRVIVITGGTDGIGLALVNRLRETGSRVYIIGRNAEKLKTFKDKTTEVHQCDVTDFKGLESIISPLEKIDVLINSAGVFVEGPLANAIPDAVSSAIDINVKGTIYASKLVVPKMKQRKYGTIVNLSSTVGLEGRAGLSIYSSTKYAISGFTESLKLELIKDGIKVVGIYPGALQTSFRSKGNVTESLVLSDAKWMTAEDIADVILFILTRPDHMLIDKIVMRNMT